MMDMRNPHNIFLEIDDDVTDRSAPEHFQALIEFTIERRLAEGSIPATIRITGGPLTGVTITGKHHGDLIDVVTPDGRRIEIMTSSIEYLAL